MTNECVTVHPIVMEASDAEDRHYMRSTMDKQDMKQINANLLQKLYQSTLQRNTYDFSEVEKSAGDIEKMKCYGSTMECLDTLDELLKKNRISEPALGEVRLAISNLVMLKPFFMNGFKLKNSFVIIAYNTTVMAVIDAVTMLIAEYMNYIVGPSKEPFKLTGKTDKSRGILSIDSLKTFNGLVKDNTLQNTLLSMNAPAKNNFVGTGAVVVPFITVAGLIAIVSLARQLIFYFYHTRVKTAEYLEMESSFLEANRLSVEASKLPPEKKQKVLMKQDKVILKMRRLADRLHINMEDAGSAARAEEKKENSSWDLKTIEKDMANKKMEGKSFTII